MKVFNSGAIGISLAPSPKVQESTGAGPAPLADGCNQWLPTHLGTPIARGVLAAGGMHEGDAAAFAASCHFEFFASQ